MKQFFNQMKQALAFKSTPEQIGLAYIIVVEALGLIGLALIIYNY